MHYLMLAALFVAALITCNLVANKFVVVNMGFKEFTLSAGILAYPVTFLITDVLSEIFGKRRTQNVVWVGFGATVFTLGILFLGGHYSASGNSPISDDIFETVFKNSPRLIAASMVAYLAAQFIDVRVFHFWKRLTKGKMLWVRNNFSTMFSQLIDTTLVVSVIFLDFKDGQLVPKYGWTSFGMLIFDGWLFKVMWAAIDTPVFYLLSWWYKRRFRIGDNAQVSKVEM